MLCQQNSPLNVNDKAYYGQSRSDRRCKNDTVLLQNGHWRTSNKNPLRPYIGNVPSSFCLSVSILIYSAVWLRLPFDIINICAFIFYLLHISINPVQYLAPAMSGKWEWERIVSRTSWKGEFQKSRARIYRRNRRVVGTKHKAVDIKRKQHRWECDLVYKERQEG